MTESPDDPLTLDPPGTIAVIGAGPLGIEAALYGRFLGYDVTLIESESIGHTLTPFRDHPLPMLPDRCLSPLALSAIEAQSPEAPPIVLPTSIAQWIDEVLVPLTESDLMAGRLRCPYRVNRIEHVAAETDEDVPPDFRLSLAGIDGKTDEVEAEAVIIAVGQEAKIETEFATPCDYYFRIDGRPESTPEQILRQGWKEIVNVFAGLAGRETLDLYRPQRS